MIILSHKKPGFHPFSRRYIFGKTKGVGQIDLARVKNKKSFKVKQKIFSLFLKRFQFPELVSNLIVGLQLIGY